MRRRRWGQHFLASDAACRRIIEAFNPTSTEAVMEIGPGRGALTRELAVRAGALVAVEIDPALAGNLASALAASSRVRVVTADILDVLHEGRDGADSLARLAREIAFPPETRWRVIGNLPYGIATVIVHRLLSLGPSVSDALLMVQREVADRLLAPAGSRDYGYITILVALLSEARRVLDLGPGAFRPQPRVRSTVVSLTLPEEPPLPAAEIQRLESLLKAAFSQRRKKLVNALTSLGREAGAARAGPTAPLAGALDRAGLSPAARPEEISPDAYLRLARILRGNPWHLL